MKQLLRKIDVLFYDLHYQFPAAMYSSGIGGVVTVLVTVVLCVVAFYFIYEGWVIDRFALEKNVVPGLLQFQPSFLDLRFQLFLIASGSREEFCSKLCDRQSGWLTFSPLLPWDVSCRVDLDRGGCILTGRPNPPNHLLPQSFWLAVRIPGASVHAWQSRLDSTIQEHSFYAAANVTAPETTVFAGLDPSTMVFQLEPTTLHDSTGAHQGYVPFTLLRSLGGYTGTTASFFPSLVQHGVGLNCSFAVAPRVSVFQEVAVANTLVITARIVAFSSFSFLLAQFLVYGASYVQHRGLGPHQRALAVSLGLQACEHPPEAVEEEHQNPAPTVPQLAVWLTDTDERPPDDMELQPEMELQPVAQRHTEHDPDCYVLC
eukprot:CAMPEP_0175915466 /NCGR_PEP_ID=MMETSP0108-20121206/10332_1 /TAXON_ID=195067 ORGANISM="Goniomonas pacifica, Strain CCMP1869" /NCGR_SAMPLE_ID=MMETSP0108 /ASSEMBLY_ACC=CAM_ASM_000204 /LENGTH=372 /DNA_ID=CAMNT_0017237961 /DNA_START=36 /DNA_END=1155 /DNA_ORIENTATION=+